MAELVFHFALPDGADPAAAAEALSRKLAELDDVDTAEVSADETRSVDALEIIAIITLASQAVGVAADATGSTVKLVRALTELVNVTKELGEALGLKKGRLEVGLRQVPVEAVTDGDLREVGASS